MLSISPPSNQDISATIGAILYQDYPVSLVNSYKGLELSQETHIVDLSPTCASLQATRFDYMNLLEGETTSSHSVFLHSRAFPMPVAAQVKDFDCVRGTVNLSDLAYHQCIERKHERVQPKDPTYAQVKCRRHSCRVYVNDISVSGVGILVNRHLNTDLAAQAGANISMDFKLSTGEEYNRLKGSLCYVQPVSDALLKIGIELKPSARQANLLAQYVDQRRDEIMQEVTQSFSTLHEPRGVENLYF